MQFQYLPPPTNDDVMALLLRIRTRALKVVFQFDDSMVTHDKMALVAAQYEACQPWRRPGDHPGNNSSCKPPDRAPP